MFVAYKEGIGLIFRSIAWLGWFSDTVECRYNNKVSGDETQNFFYHFTNLGNFNELTTLMYHHQLELLSSWVKNKSRSWCLII